MVAALLIALSWAGEAPKVVHVPPYSVESRAPLALEVRTSTLADGASLELRYRTIGQERWKSLSFEATDSGSWVAVIPGAEVEAPGVEYFIVSVEGLSKGDRFASASTPHQVRVAGSRLDNRAARELERVGGRRSEVALAGEWADFDAGEGLDDQWTLVSGHFQYRPMRLVRTVELGVVHLRGVAPIGQAVEVPAGFDYGYSRVELAPHELFSLSVGPRLGADEIGWRMGLELGFRLGVEPGTHLSVQGGWLQGTGVDGEVRLDWATVPRLPMHAAVRVSTWPNGEYFLDPNPAVMARAGVSLPLGAHALIDLEAGYQARSYTAGGPSLGGGLTWSW